MVMGAHRWQTSFAYFPQLYDMYSGIMQYLPGRHNRIYYLIEELKDFIASRVKKNEASLDPQNPRDFIDCFLTKMHQVLQLFPLISSIPSLICTFKLSCRHVRVKKSKHCFTWFTFIYRWDIKTVKAKTHTFKINFESKNFKNMET